MSITIATTTTRKFAQSLKVEDIEAAIRDSFVAKLAEQGHFVDPSEVVVDLDYHDYSCRARVRAEIEVGDT